MLYGCFYPDCKNKAIVCYGNGGMGEPGTCVCENHIQDEVHKLYKRIKQLYNDNEELVANRISWNPVEVEAPINTPVYLARWWGDVCIGRKKEDGSWYYLDGIKIDDASHRPLFWANITYPALPSNFNEHKWRSRDDS